MPSFLSRAGKLNPIGIANPRRVKSPAATPLPESDGPVASLDRTLTWRMHTLHKLTDQESLRRYPAEAGLSLSDGRCLTAIGSFGPLSVNELAQKANLNKAQASRAAQSLVDQGLVRKADVPHDGRGVQLSLTARGRKAFARTMDLVERRNREIFGCLSVDEQRQLATLFDRLIAHVQAPAGTPEPEAD